MRSRPEGLRSVAHTGETSRCLADAPACGFTQQVAADRDLLGRLAKPQAMGQPNSRRLSP